MFALPSSEHSRGGSVPRRTATARPSRPVTGPAPQRVVPIHCPNAQVTKPGGNETSYTDM
jgi:hypothetical protein